MVEPLSSRIKGVDSPAELRSSQSSALDEKTPLTRVYIWTTGHFLRPFLGIHPGLFFMNPSFVFIIVQMTATNARFASWFGSM